MAPGRDKPTRRLDSELARREKERNTRGHEDEAGWTLNFDKDRRLLFYHRPFSNQWPSVFGNVIRVGVAFLLAQRGGKTKGEWRTRQLRLLTFTGGV